MKDYIVIIPGIFRRESFLKNILIFGKKNGIDIEIFRIKWIGKNTYQKAVKDLENKVKLLTESGYRVSLIGTSAGASIAFNIFSRRDSNIYKLVTVCGPIRNLNSIPFKIGCYFSPTWENSLLESGHVTKTKRANILTIIPVFDELVGISSMLIEGSKTINIPGREHLYSINLTISKYCKQIVNFIKG